MTSELSTTEQLAAEAATIEKPAGSPNLWPFLQLPRRKRADFLRRLDGIVSKQDELNISEDSDASVSDAAAMYDLLADMEELLATVAADSAAFAEWAAAAADEELSALLSWYMDKFQVGEAKASRS